MVIVTEVVAVITSDSNLPSRSGTLHDTQDRDR